MCHTIDDWKHSMSTPTYGDLLTMQDMLNQYHYDHTMPRPEQTSLILHTLTHRNQTQARTNGERLGLWYWSNAYQEWLAPPRKEWVDV